MRDLLKTILSLHVLSVGICFFFVSACKREPCQLLHEAVSGTEPGSWLSANPNPVPAGDPHKAVGSTVISWDTGGKAVGELWVKIDREDERLVSRAASGAMKIDWIQFDSLYEFRLYAKKRSRLLATLTVSRDD